MKKSIYYPLLLSSMMILQACNSPVEDSAEKNNTLSAFLTVHNEYCDGSFSTPAELESAISKDQAYKSIKDYDGIYEKVVSNVSYAVSPESDGCTTDLKLKPSEQSEMLFSFDQLNKELLEKGYTVKGKKSIHSEMGLDNETLQVIEQKYISPNNTVTTLMFPLERENQFFMTFFAEKYGMKGASIKEESDVDMFEI